MPSVAENLALWESYSWPRDGDEWTDQAHFNKTPYHLWKVDLIKAFLEPSVTRSSVVLEIGVGHGRWTEVLVKLAGKVVGVDLSPRCVGFCQRLFPEAEFHVNDGSTLPQVKDRSVDYVWSYDSFVHIEWPETASYIGELARVLRPGGVACIHHPGAPTREQRVTGWRSQVTAEVFQAAAQRSGFEVRQTNEWGPWNRSNTKKFSDCISIMRVKLNR